MTPGLQINRVGPRAAAVADLFDVAILIPCFNEDATIAAVVRGFREALPTARIYVYDNNSTDRTCAAAEEAGAVVRAARLQGKGNVVRLMFSDIEADAYVLVDGDGTYEAAAAARMVEALIAGRLDMVNGARIADHEAAYRVGHRFGNRILTGLVEAAFGQGFRDMLSGYRVFSRRFVKSFPAASRGFEIETELTVHALQMRVPAREIGVAYYSRPEGSCSKLNTIRDGLRILRMIGLLLREERPLQFFGTAAAMAIVVATGLAGPVLVEYLGTGLVPRIPSLIVAVALVVIALLSLVCGLILDAVSRARLEQRRFAYLAIPPPRGESAMGLTAKTPGARLFAGFVMVGALGFATDAGLLSAGLALGLPAAAARALSVSVALQVTFVLNGLVVFKSLTPSLLPGQWIAYMASNGFGAGCNYVIFVALTASRAPVVSERVPAFIAAAAMALLVNYAGTRFLAFRRVAPK